MINNLPFGIVLVDKHSGVTSHDIVWKLRKIYGTKQVGHTGTLDPMATGILPVLIGRAVKAAEFAQAENKSYTATFVLGIETDTEDTSGNVISSSDIIPTEEDVLKAVSSFTGVSKQVPPMYSAKKVNGKKLVDLAREGITVEREPQTIEIFGLNLKKISEKEYSLDVDCSKGTYIRTLCADIGKKLGCGAAMSSLRRTKTGPFDVAQAHTVSELETMSEEELKNTILPLETIFENYPAVHLNDFYAKLSRNGAEIYLKKIGKQFDVGQILRIYAGDAFVSLGQVCEYPDGPAIRTLKQFVID